MLRNAKLSLLPRSLLILSLSANVALGLGMWRLRSRLADSSLPTSEAGWLHQSAGVSFARMPSKPGSVVMLGDSLTAYGPWGELFGPFLNRGVQGDSVEGIDARLSEVIVRKPAQLFLLIGINDLRRGASAQKVALGIERIVTRLAAEAPTTSVFVQSVFPVGPTLEHEVARTSIVALNRALYELCARSAARYVDVSAALADGRGLLKHEYTYDGLHLNADGYLVWARVLAPLLPPQR